MFVVTTLCCSLCVSFLDAQYYSQVSNEHAEVQFPQLPSGSQDFTQTF